MSPPLFKEGPYVLSAMLSQKNERCLADIENILANNQIQTSKTTTKKYKKNESTIHFFFIFFSQYGRLQNVKESLFALALEYKFNISLVHESIFNTPKKLIVFDMDSTLIQQEVIDEIADFAGLKEKVSAITQKAMQGELDFNESLRERVSLLKGILLKDLDSIKARLQITKGAKELVDKFKKDGAQIAVLSGGFTLFTGFIKEQLGLDYHFANTLEIKDGMLTGKTEGPIVNAAEKARLLKQIAQNKNISINQTMAIGDGANDIQMLLAAGLGVAFRAKPALRKNAAAVIETAELDALLPLLDNH